MTNLIRIASKFWAIILVMMIILCSVAACDSGLGGMPRETSGAAEASNTAESSSKETGGEEPVPAVTYLEGLPQDPWYFDWEPLYATAVDPIIEDRLLNPLCEEDCRNVLKTPVVYETVSEELSFRFDFFREHWCNRSMMQVRVTVTNLSDTELSVRDAPYVGIGLIYADGSRGRPQNGWIPPSDEASMAASHMVDYLEPVTLASGGTYVAERVFMVGADPDLPITHLEMRLWTNDDASTDAYSSVTVSVPLEVTVLEEPEWEVQGPPSVLDTDTPWYIEGWEPDTEIPVPEVPAEMQSLAVELPEVFEEEHDGLSLKAEFFQSYYPLGKPIKVRLTLTNRTGEEIRFLANGTGIGYFEEKDNADAALHPGWQYFPESHEKEYYTRGFYEDPSLRCITLPEGESVTLEYVYTGTLAFFEPDTLYYFKVNVKCYDDSLQPLKRYSFRFPLRVAEILLYDE